MIQISHFHTGKVIITIPILLVISLLQVYLSTNVLHVINGEQYEATQIISNVQSNGDRKREIESNMYKGLWIGRHYDEIQIDPKNKDIHIVISYCAQDIKWIKNFVQGYNISSIHIISKCGRPVHNAPIGSTIEVMPNLGRNDHSYAHYITAILDSKMVESKSDEKNSIVVFLKDNIVTHQKGLKSSNFDDLVTYAASSRGFSCLRVPENVAEPNGLKLYSAYHNVSYLRTFKLGGYHGFTRTNSNQTQFDLGFNNLGHMMDSLNIETQEIVQVCYGGTFAASVSNIKKVDESVWKSVEKMLSRGDNIQEGHFVERSWGALLSTGLSQFETEILLNRSISVFTDPCCYNGVLMTKT